MMVLLGLEEDSGLRRERRKEPEKSFSSSNFCKDHWRRDRLLKAFSKLPPIYAIIDGWSKKTDLLLQCR